MGRNQIKFTKKFIKAENRKNATRGQNKKKRQKLKKNPKKIINK